jgi:hypothetical protein
LELLFRLILYWIRLFFASFPRQDYYLFASTEGIANTIV